MTGCLSVCLSVCPSESENKTEREATKSTLAIKLNRNNGRRADKQQFLRRLLLYYMRPVNFFLTSSQTRLGRAVGLAAAAAVGPIKISELSKVALLYMIQPATGFYAKTHSWSTRTFCGLASSSSSSSSAWYPFLGMRFQPWSDRRPSSIDQTLLWPLLLSIFVKKI